LLGSGREGRDDEVERTDNRPSESTPLLLARSSSIAEDSVRARRLCNLVNERAIRDRRGPGRVKKEGREVVRRSRGTKAGELKGRLTFASGR